MGKNWKDDLKNTKNSMMESIEMVVGWLRKDPDQTNYEIIEEEIQHLLNAMRMIDFLLNQMRTVSVD